MLTITGLYMLAGLIEALTGETDTRRMGGLYATEPMLGVLFVVLMLAVAGVPPFLGFWPKLLLIEGGMGRWQASGDGWALALWVAVLVNALLSLVAVTRLWAHVFWRNGVEGAASEALNPVLRPVGRRPFWLRMGPALVLTLIVALAGLFPDLLLEFGRRAASALLSPADYVSATGLQGHAP